MKIKILSFLPKCPSQFQLHDCFLTKLWLWGVKSSASASPGSLLGLPQLNRAARAVDFRAKCRKQLAPNLLSMGAKQSRAVNCLSLWEQEPGTCQMLQCMLSCAGLPGAPAVRWQFLPPPSSSTESQLPAGIPLTSFSRKYFNILVPK